MVTRSSMMSCRRGWSIVVALVVVCMLFVSCTTKVDYTLGSEFIPTSQNMELKRRVYKLGSWSEGDTTKPCTLSTAALYVSDSIPSVNLNNGYFGLERDAVYGERRAGFMSQMLFSLSLDEKRGWGYRPIFDSMQLSLYVTAYHGDTTRSHRFEVYEIVSNDYLAKDSNFYVNFDPTPYIGTKPIFEFDFPNQDKGIYVGDMDNPSNVEVLLEPTSATRDYVERLMLMTELDANGGYALDKDSLYVEGNERKFLDVVRGIYIAPKGDITGEGAMFATDLENTALLLYSRGRYEEDPTIIRDTTYMIYNLFIDDNNYDGEAGNISITSVEHDYTSSSIDIATLGTELTTTYVTGLGGVVTEVSFTDEFIQSLADIVHAHDDAVVSVNQALISFYMEGAYSVGSDYDYLDIPSSMVVLLDGAMSRMGMYADYDRLMAITDYAYTVESQYALAYDGYLNRSLACYTMDISSYIQSLMMAAADNVDEQGVVKFDKFSADYTPESESLVMRRRFYLAPDAGALFDFQRQSLSGGDVGGGSSAPIKLELTYTVVK